MFQTTYKSYKFDDKSYLIPGEFIDITILNEKDSTFNKIKNKENAFETMFDKYKINEYSYFSYNINEYISDLYASLFYTFKYTWDSDKYAKRIYRLFFLIMIFEKYDENLINDFINLVQEADINKYIQKSNNIKGDSRLLEVVKNNKSMAENILNDKKEYNNFITYNNILLNNLMLYKEIQKL